MRDGVTVGVMVGVFVGVCEDVTVRVMVGVLVGVEVGVLVGVKVGVTVGGVPLKVNVLDASHFVPTKICTSYTPASQSCAGWDHLAMPSPDGRSFHILVSKCFNLPFTYQRAVHCTPGCMFLYENTAYMLLMGFLKSLLGETGWRLSTSVEKRIVPTSMFGPGVTIL